MRRLGVKRGAGWRGSQEKDWVAPSLALLWFLVALTGCDNTPPGIPPAVFTVVMAVWKLRKMADDPLLRNETTGEPKTFLTTIGHHVRFFLRFRAEAHLKTQRDTDQVTLAVAAEYDMMRSFVSTTIGLDAEAPAALIKGTDTTATRPPHLDLNDVLRVTVTAPPVTDGQRKLQEIKRWERAMEILWRAAALETEVWTPSFSPDAMKELLDRRLRIVERMVYQISSDVSGSLQPESAKPHGPWHDGVRVRMFQYPFLGTGYADRIGAANIVPAGQIWRPDFDNGLLYYNEENGTRIRDAAKDEFPSALGANTYPRDLLPGGNPAAAVDHLFTASNDDWWDRSWIYCDQVVAALHLESLRFGKLRRTEKDDAFNSVVNARLRGQVQLRPLLPNVPGETALMGDDSTRPPGEPRFFANSGVSQLQMGDHVVFYNSIMYGLLSDGAWSLENAIVVQVDSKWDSNGIGEYVRLMGHGTADVFAGRFREERKLELDGMLKAARKRAKATVGDSTPWLRNAAPLVRWAPFNEPWVDADGAPQPPWWIRVPYKGDKDWAGRAVGRDATLFTLEDSVEYSPTAGFLSAPPDAGGGWQGAAYFPLWCPPENGKWRGYIQRRLKGDIPTTFKLAPVEFDGRNIPALSVPWQFVPGATTPQVHAVRPIVVR